MKKSEAKNDLQVRWYYYEEILPFYGTSISNYHSWNIAINCGFRPAWVEIGAEKIHEN